MADIINNIFLHKFPLEIYEQMFYNIIKIRTLVRKYIC